MKKTDKNKAAKIIKIIVAVLVCMGFAGTAAVFGVSALIKNKVADGIIPVAEIKDKDYDCILVLGCGLKDDGTPSHMLEDRILCGVEAYKLGLSKKLLMSGDHGHYNYDEVSAMKTYALQTDVSSEDIFLDHAGFSTYESIYRARDIFGAKKILIVTQEYHLYRALYIASKLGVQADGISASLREYSGQTVRDLREVLARDKDFVYCIIKPLPKYLGEKIALDGNGDITNG